MWFLIGLAFPIVEVWLLFRVGAEIGLANTFFYLLTCVVVGIGLIRSQARYLTATMQTAVATRQNPSNQLMHSIALFLSGLLFVFPGYISTALAVLLLLPGTRHLAVAMMKRKMQSLIQQGAVRFSGGMGGANFGGFQGFTWTSHGPVNRPPMNGEMRDVSPLEIDSQSNHEVIDITPTKKD